MLNFDIFLKKKTGWEKKQSLITESWTLNSKNHVSRRINCFWFFTTELYSEHGHNVKVHRGKVGPLFEVQSGVKPY